MNEFFSVALVGKRSSGGEPAAEGKGSLLEVVIST